MKLLELTVEVPPSDLDGAIAAVMALGVAGVEVEDDETDREAHATVRAWFPADAEAGGFLAALAPRGATTRVVRLDWKAEEGAIPVGRRFLVAGPGDPLPRTRRIPLVVDGAAAFGDGRHPTTVLCLQAIERAFRESPPRSVLDVGTGSGVLALAAARLGADDVVATDIDALAREAAAAAALRHGVAIEVRASLPDRRFDLVVANLHHDPLLELAGALAARTQGRLFVSGVVRDARPEVEAALRSAGLRVTRRRARGWWVGIELAAG